jgi:hypothetical protein
LIRLAELARRILSEGSPNNIELRVAVKGPYLVRIDYMNKDGSQGGERIILPVAVGDTIRGNLAVRAYQYDGHTETLNPKYKLFLVKKITSWSMTQRYKKPPPPYNAAGDKSMARVHFQK